MRISVSEEITIIRNNIRNKEVFIFEVHKRKGCTST